MNASFALKGSFDSDVKKVALYNHRAGLYGFQKYVYSFFNH
jgi:hypothetical protein